MQQNNKWGDPSPFRAIFGGTEEIFGFLCTLDSERIEAYAFATGDYNCLHDPEGEEKIVHGGLTLGVISGMFFSKFGNGTVGRSSASSKFSGGCILGKEYRFHFSRTEIRGLGNLKNLSVYTCKIFDDVGIKCAEIQDIKLIIPKSYTST